MPLVAKRSHVPASSSYCVSGENILRASARWDRDLRPVAVKAKGTDTNTNWPGYCDGLLVSKLVLFQLMIG